MTFAKGIQSKMEQCKRLGYERLRNIGLSQNGTIFGGFVRDEYIAEYYTEKYKNKNSNESELRYWDTEHSPETSARLLIPKDMDISFKSLQEADEFIAAIKQVPEFDYISVVHDTNPNSAYNCSIKNSIASIRHVNIKMYYGREPFLNRGRTISMDIDVVVPNNSNLEPPFGNLDMLCNGFIVTKEGGKRFSRHTGTIIDMYSDYERAVVTPQIIRDLCHFKTYICMTNNTERETINISAFNRVKKMMCKKVPWEMLNMPYKNEVYKCSESDTTEECCICSCEIENNAKVAYTTITKEDMTTVNTGKLHEVCMMKYIDYQIMNLTEFRRNNPGKVLCFKCPSRNSITFTRCKLDIQFAYKTEL
jgi:hypothetical protein